MHRMLIVTELDILPQEVDISERIHTERADIWETIQIQIEHLATAMKPTPSCRALGSCLSTNCPRPHPPTAAMAETTSWTTSRNGRTRIGS